MKSINDMEEVMSEEEEILEMEFHDWLFKQYGFCQICGLSVMPGPLLKEGLPTLHAIKFREWLRMEDNDQ